MSISESLRKEAYPYSKGFDKLKRYISEEIDLNENFPAIQVIGSHQKGYATEESDVDFKLYFYDVPRAEAVEKYSSVEDKLRDGGYKPCPGSPLVEGHKIEHEVIDLNSINADEIKPSFVFPDIFYSLSSKVEMLFSEKIFEEYITLADVFGEGFIEHPCMEKHRKEIAEDLKKNKNSEEVWEVTDKLYRSHLSHVFLRKYDIPIREMLSIEGERRKKFGLPDLEEIEV